MIHIGDAVTGEKVEIPIFHTGIFGQSGVGKTVLIKYMMTQAVKEGFKIIIFDSKLTRAQFEGLGEIVPFYLKESTQHDVFRSLLEGMRQTEKGNMQKFRSAFISICKGAKDFDEIGERLEFKLADKRFKGWTRSMYEEIQSDYLDLVEILEGHPFTEDIVGWVNSNKHGPILRMPVRNLPNLALQGLVVGSVIDAFLPHPQRIIFIVDEAPNFVNQQLFNPAKRPLSRLDSQGRDAEQFGWYTGQTISGFDKKNMKNLWYWVMGREMEQNEVDDIYNTQTQKILKKDQIKMLKVREFLVATPDFTKLVRTPKMDEVLLNIALEAELEVPWKEPYQQRTPATDKLPEPIGGEDWSDVDQEISRVEAKLR